MTHYSQIALFLLASSALPLLAQDTVRVDPVIITATRTPMTLGSLPVAVTVIDGVDLRAKGITSVGEALRQVSSAYVAQAGSHGATTSLFLRGGESKYVKVLVDGVPANDPGGAYDFASMTTDNVERIEIVRGPASVIHGADAVTGVVNVITRRGGTAAATTLDVRASVGPRDRITASGESGALRMLDATASVTGGSTTGTYSLALGRHESNGLYVLNNDYRNSVLSGSFAYSPGANVGVRLSLRYNDYRYHYPTSGGGTPVDSNAYRLEDRFVVGAEVEKAVTSTIRAVLSINSSVNEGGTTDEMDTAGGSSFVSQDRTRRRGAELRLHAFPAARIALTAGVQMEQQDQRSQFQSESPFGPFSGRFDANRRNLGMYGEAVLTPASSVTITGGLRADDNEQFGRFGTGRFGISYRPLADTRLRLTAGTAFREPSFFENYATGFTMGNPDLRPERVLAFDAGVDQELLGGRARLTLGGFMQRFRNMIDYQFSATACGANYCNVAEATSNGLELEGAAHVAGPVHARMAATFLKTTVVEPGFDNTSAGLYREGESLIRRPERNVTADVEYRGSALTASVRLHAMGVREDKDFTVFPATPVTLPSYERMDLAADYRLPLASTSTSLLARVENLTNVNYQNVYNFLAPRRTITLGARTSF